MKKSILMMLLFLMGMGAMQRVDAADKEVYTEFVEETGTLTYYYDDQREARTGKTLVYTPYISFLEIRDKVTKGVLDASMSEAAMTNMGNMFAGLYKMTEIEGLNLLNTDAVTNMGNMFFNCQELTAVDLSSFKTDNVTNMRQMFCECHKITSLDIRKFNTSNVTDMRYMFKGCYGLTSLDVSSFNTANVTDMNCMFAQCHQLASLDVRSFNTANVTDMGYMFYGCDALTAIYCNKDWTTGKVETSDDMFAQSTQLVGGNGTAFDEEHIDIEYARPDGVDEKPGYFTMKYDIYSEFVEETGTLTYYYDDQIKSRTGKTDVYNPNIFLPFSGYADKVTKCVLDASMAEAEMTDISYMFCGLENMTEIIGLDQLNTSHIYYMFGTFMNCKSLKSIDLSGFNTANVTDMSYLFYHCESLKSLDLSGFNTEKTGKMTSMFFGCSSLTSLDLHSLNTEYVQDMGGMFSGCSSLTSLDISSFNTQRVRYMSNMFSGCVGLSSIDLSGFNTEEVSEMRWMFKGCVGLPSLDMSGFNTEGVATMEGMFEGCSALGSLDLTSFQTTNLTNTASMFSGCSALTKIYCNDDWSAGSVTSSEDMFLNCYALKGSKGTKYDAGKVDIEYARPDGMGGKNGYFTRYEIYGVTDGTVMTVYYDTQISSRGGVAEWWEDYGITSTVTKVIFDASCDNARPTSTSHWFSMFEAMDTISGLEHLNTKEVTDMSHMFFNCPNLLEVDLSHFNTEKVTNMGSMFYNCQSLSDLDLSSFETGKVTYMVAMFDGCKGLQTLNLGENFTTDEAEAMSVMFRDCSSLCSISGIERFDIKKAKDLYGMFTGCSSLSVLDLSEWTTPELTETQKMFEDCWSLTLVNIKQFDMSKVTNATKMFNGCSSLRYIIHEGDWSGLSGLSSSYDIFADCTSLKGEKGTGYNYEHINQSWARPDGGEGDEGYFSKSVPELYAVLSDEGKTLTIRYDTKKEENDGLTLGSESIDGQKVTKVVFDASVADARPTSTKDWFSEFEALEEIENLYYLNTEAVTDMSYMFYDCSSLKTLDLGNFKTRNVKNMYGMFAYCTSLTNVPLYNFDTRNVEDMSYMFYECKSLTTLDLYNFNTGKVKIMQAMFARCSSLTSLGLNKFDTRNVEGMSGMFQECPSLVGLDLSSFDMSNVENVAFMFYGCSSLAYIVHSGDWSKKYFKSWCSTQVFTNCFELHGDNGTTYDEDFTGISLARPDGGKLSPGYFSTSVPECYAVPSNANKTLTLYYDGKLEERGGISFWMDETYRENVTKIVLDTSMVYYRPGDLSLWFSGFQVLKEIEHLDYLNTSQTVQMVSMFEGCAALESFDLSRFDTRNVNGMSGMFKDCKSIKELHLASFDTEHANSYSNMFQGCTSLEVVDIRPFCKNEGAYFNEMFADCPALKTIYWYADWTDVEDYYATDMFKGCTALTGDHETAYDEGHVDNSWARLDEGEGKSGYFSLFDGQEPYTMYDETEKTLTYYNDNLRFKREGILDDCFERKHFEEYQEIVTKVVFTPEFVTVTPTSTNLWFFYCLKLETIEGLEYFNTEKVTDMYGMFANCTSLTSLDLSSFNTANVTDMFSMFYDCKKLTSLDLSSFNTANVTDMSYMFASCSALTSLDLSSFNTEKVKDKSCMFENCSALKTILCIEDWSTMIELEYDSYMFEGCVNLTGGKGTPFYDTKVDKTYARPDGGPESETPGYFTVPTYTVTFLDKDGNPIGEPQTVDYGQAAVAPTAPEEKGYEFTGWDKAFDNVTEDLTVQALYEAIVLYTLTVIVEPAEGGTFTVTGLDENQQGAFFAEFVITATPNEGYELVGWKDGDMMLDSKELTINRVLYGDMTITILFKKKTGTGVDEIVNRQSSNRTYLLDGVLYIERDGKTYDVTGRVISRN